MRGKLISLLIAVLLSTQTDSRCIRRPIETSRESGVGDGGFRIKIVGDPSTYRPEQVYMVTLEASVPNQKIANFQLISAKQQDPFDENEDLGRFMYAQSLTVDRSFLPPGCSHIFGGRLYNRRSAVVVSWRAPPAGSGCVEFRALVSEFTDVWYKDAGGLTKVICEDTDDPLLRMPKCCACGVAKYQMTFEGFWSRETHPRDFPSGHNEGLLHWSNIAGASHDRTYTIWRPGEKASKGVQTVCELGDTALLEREMRRKGEYIRSVIRAPGIWSRNLRQNRFARFSVNSSHHLVSLLTMIGPSPDWCVGVSAVNLCQQNCSWARRIVLDLLPWDAGTDSGLTYTSDNVPTKPQDVIRYLTNSWPNDPASPFFGPEPIAPFARITFDRTSPGPAEDSRCVPDDGVDEKSGADSQDSSCVTSPWSDWGPCSTTCGVGMRVRNRMLKSALGGCSHIQTMEKEPCLGTENFCSDGKPSTLPTPEQELSPEIRPPVPSRFQNLPNTCELTDWSEWSPCSVTCGSGLRRRSRQLVNPEFAHLCSGAAGAEGRHLEETQPCSNSQFPNCSSVNQLINYSEICKLPAVRGPCTGNFPRWFYDPRQNRCIAFSYGGCRGNQNRFFSRAQCSQLCSEKGQASPVKTADAGKSDRNYGNKKNEKLDDENEFDDQRLVNSKSTDLSSDSILGYYPAKADDEDASQLEMAMARSKSRAEVLDCELTQWTSWSSCSSSCGRGAETRQRHVITPPSGGGKPCPPDLAQRRNCRNPYRPHCEKKPIDCQVGGWAEWSECTAGCLPTDDKGMQPVRTRTMQIISRARYGGRPCPLRGERTQKQLCSWLPTCSNAEDSNNNAKIGDIFATVE